MNTEELISVIVPVYNTEKYVRETLDSLIHQTYKNIEILVVDDGSKDESPAICDEYGIIDKRVKVFHRKNEGLAASRQFGFDNSNGVYCATIDSDDYVAPDFIEKLYMAIKKNHADVAVCGVSCFSDSTRQVGQNYLPSLISDEKIVLTKEILASDYQKIARNLILTDSWNKLYRLEFVRAENVRFTLKREYCCGQDLQFNYELALHCPIYCICRESLLFHRANPNSLMHIKEKNLQESLEFITEGLIEESKKFDLNIKEQLAAVYYEFIGIIALDIYYYGGTIAKKHKKYQTMIAKKNRFLKKHLEDLDRNGLKNFYVSRFTLPSFMLGSALWLDAFFICYDLLGKVKHWMIRKKE